MSSIESFVSTHLCLAPGKKVITTDVIAAYATFNKGSLEGKVKLYAFIKNMEGVEKVRQMFCGIELRESVNTGPAPATTESEEESADVNRSVIELRRLELEVRRVELEATKVKDVKEREERLAKLEEMKVKNAKEMKEMEINSAKEIEAIKANNAKEIKAMDLAWEKEKVERQDTEKKRDREFWAEQNNKNRKMYVESEHWNKYLDVRVYGTPSKQYITSESLFDNLDFRVFAATGKVDPSSRDLVLNEIKAVATTIPIWELESARACEVVDVGRILKLVNDVMEKIQASREALREAFQPVQELLGRIPAIASRDDHRFMDSEYNRSIAAQNPDKYTTMKDKHVYIREANRAKMEGKKIHIQCYCCHRDVSLASSSCHRSHNIPRSAGGDWSVDNVYLCCANCNTDMANTFTVLEYKVILFTRKLQAMQN